MSFCSLSDPFLTISSGAAVLVDDPAAHLQPSLDQLEQWSKEQEILAKAQQAVPDVKSPKADKALSEEAIRKRKEREEKRRAAQIAAGVDPTEPTPSSAQENTTVAQHTIVIPAASDSLAWYDPNFKAYSTLEGAKEAGIWDFPSNLEERARCGVFHDLWKKGFFMGSGIKFGGEFLVYPGDPLRYHSHFTATVIDSPQSSLRPMEIVAHGRLGTATKKSHLLCGWDDDKKQVSYVSIEWAGFG